MWGEYEGRRRRGEGERRSEKVEGKCRKKMIETERDRVEGVMNGRDRQVLYDIM